MVCAQWWQVVIASAVGTAVSLLVLVVGLTLVAWWWEERD